MTNGLEKLIERLGDPDRAVRETALICVQALCDYGTRFSNPPSPDSQNFPDDIQINFISTNGVQKLIERLHNSNRDMQATTLHFVRALCIHGIVSFVIASLDSHHFPEKVRTTFIRTNSVEGLVEKTYNSRLDVRKITDDCVKALCDHGTNSRSSHLLILTIFQMTLEPTLFWLAASRS